jgi:serine/threonine protein kinase
MAVAEAFGPFSLHRLLGRGGMAEAFLATRDGSEEQFVLKRIRPDRAGSKEYLHRFLLEAQVASRVVDPNLAKFREFGRVGECYYLTMNQVRGYSLHRLLEPIFKDDRHPPLGVAAHLGRGVLHGLAALHRVTDENGEPRPMLHRDVSPKNIIVSREGEAVLIDFGIAKDVYGPSLTIPGQLIGTARYMAPEHRRAEFIDTRADVFSASVVLFELFAGEHPWPPETSMRELLKTRLEPPEVSDAVRARVPTDVLDVMTRGLASDADDRWHDCIDMARALERSTAYDVDAGPSAVVRWLEQANLQLDEELTAPVIDTPGTDDIAEVYWTRLGTLSTAPIPTGDLASERSSEVLAIPPLPPRRDAVLTEDTQELTAVVAQSRRRRGWTAALAAAAVVALLVGLVWLGR